ncbi:MAG: OmpA family protein [Gammaproteobacteria bacterium]|nr:OmpA family protein [Gammaproteobacteria bacterium]MBT4494487.1 OmpA family protein [Gammaproteobacteria bacterium]
MKILGLVSLTLALASCTTFDAYTGEEKISKTAIGSGIGASVGAVIAYLDNKDTDSRKRNQRILAAAAGGAAIGGGIGYYMDAQEAKLRRQLRGSGVSVERVGDNINLLMPGNITFNVNRADLQPDFLGVLDSVSLVLNEYNRTIVVVAGHTDSTGSEAFNQGLSEQRASTVSQYLSGREVLMERLDVIGFGERQPVVSNETAELRAMNRRVEITLVPVEA